MKMTVRRETSKIGSLFSCFLVFTVFTGIAMLMAEDAYGRSVPPAFSSACRAC
jgi:hypothetical protein